jgi:hypothetical protein
MRTCAASGSPRDAYERYLTSRRAAGSASIGARSYRGQFRVSHNVVWRNNDRPANAKPIARPF